MTVIGRSPPKPFHLLFLAFAFWFATDIVSFVFQSGGPAPVASYFALLATMFAAFAIHTLAGGATMTAAAWAQTRLVWFWLFGFLIWTPITFLYSSQSEVAQQRLISTTEMTVVFGSVLWFLTSYRLNKTLGLTMAATALLGSVLNIYDFLIPTFTQVSGRAAGLYGNPNAAGFILVLAMTSGISSLNVALRWPFLLFVALAVFLTFSRATWLILAISMITLSWQGFLGGKTIRLILALAFGTTVVFFAASMLSGNLANLILASPLGSYLDANTIARLGGSEFATDFSANERRDVAQLAISSFLQADNPFFGYGIGHSHEWEMRVSTHNMYLMYLVEGGIFGLLLYLGLLLILWRAASGIGRLVVFQITVYGFFSHNLLDSPGRVIFFAMVAAGLLNTARNPRELLQEKASLGNSAAYNNRSEHRRRGKVSA